jgi:hypothetical protein
MTTAQRTPVRRVRPFTPSQESPAVLSDRTVGRDAILNTLNQRLLDAASSGSRAHTLLIGPRGAGKTHLLNVAIYRARQRAEIADRLAFVRFDEDAVGISRYTDLLDEVLAKLSPSGRHPRTTDQPEAAVRETLDGCVLVLVIENLDRIFQALGKSGQQDFRAWVETSGQVMVLATAPLLFAGVRDRAMPWWGNFGIAHLNELDLNQGRQLLTRLARESGDLPLVDYLGTDEGLARLRAINDLAGGSPRIWMILADCLTVELLDELVPLVEALLEGLVPYYQQLLWDLSPVEQRLVRILADGAHQAATVSELAAAAGIGQRVAATTLGRLADIRWVRAEKAPELDQRSTWYRLQEPMVRHHFHYRSATDQPLPLIVEILRAWYNPAERRAQLARVESGSQAERFLAAALSSEIPSSDDFYYAHNVNQLVAEARRWAQGFDSASRTRESGALIDLVVYGAQHGPAELREQAARRDLDIGNGDVVAALFARCNLLDEQVGEDERVAILLRSAAQTATARTQLVLELVSACWDGAGSPESARDRLAALLPKTEWLDPLGLNIRSELANWSGVAGDVVAARDLLAELVPISQQVLGAEHRETLLAQSSLAYWSGEAGDVVAARDRFAELVPVFARVFGAEDRETLATRRNLARWLGDAGDPVTARDQLAELVPVLARVLGAEHLETLAARANLASWLGDAGDPVTARDQLAELVPVFARVFGAEHLDTLAVRSNLVRWRGETGDPVAARDQFAELVSVWERMVGPENRNTLLARWNLARWSGEAGDPVAARDQFAELVPMYQQVFSAKTWITLAAQWNLAHWSGEAGDPIAACELAGQLLAACAGLEAPPTDLQAATADVLVHNLQRLPATSVGKAGQLEDVAELDVVGLLQAAIGGSAEAVVRLPSELVPIVESLRAERTRSSDGTQPEDAALS